VDTVRPMGADPAVGAAAMVSLLRPLPDKLAGTGVVVLAIAWSLGAALANRDVLFASELPLGRAFLITMAGGAFGVASVWFGIGAVVWAMGRLLGGKARFIQILLVLSAAAPPLWIAAPVWVLAQARSGAEWAVLVLIAVLALFGFLALLVVALSSVQEFTARRAYGCIALSAVFCGSYLSLH
jgi:hypothetical protein